MTMKKVLGLDLGVASIGWAYLEENGAKSRIIRTGVRIVPVTDQEDDFKAGRSISINADRTRYRGMRRNNQRWKGKRDKLADILKANQMYPDKELLTFKEIDPYNIGKEYPNRKKRKDGEDANLPVSLKLYHLRARAVDKKIELKELGRVLLHMTQKRGYKSNRKTDASPDETTEYLDKIKENSETLKANDETIGQHFYKKFKTDPHTKVRQKIFYRHDYQDEFEQIWTRQQKEYPDILTDELKHEIGTRTLFYQRPLKSQKGLISRCQFEPGYRVAPKSSPYFQAFRIWQNINNLEITDDELRTFDLTLKDKQKLFAFLNKKDGSKKSGILKELGYSSKKFDLNFDDAQGNRTKSRLLKIFKDNDIQDTSILDFDPFIENPENQPAYRLWHLLYSIEEPEHLYKALIERFSFTREQAIAVSKCKLEKDYGNISAKAIKKILPHLINGDKYSEACERVGYKHSDSLTNEEKENKELLPHLELIKRGDLRNPVVEKILNQLAHLVNEIIDSEELGRPDEIRVELARELKMNAKKRQQVSKSYNDRKKTNQKIREILQAPPFNFKNVSRNALDRYKLWEETGGISVYTGKSIKLTNLYDKSLYDIEHIIPKARLFDDSFLNKTICESHINKDKDASTAHDYMEKKGEKAYQAYVQRVKQIKSKPKRDRLMMAEKDIPEGFIERQKKDSQYIARTAIKMLETVCKNVHSTTGSVTDVLRHQWGLTDMMKELNFEKYKKQERIEWRERPSGERYFVIKDWSKREDHRHHAMDAIVVACTKQGYIQQLNNLNKTFVTEKTQSALRTSARKFAPPWASFRQDARKALSETMISFKSKQRVATKNKNKIKHRDKNRKPQELLTPRGFLHKETVYAKMKRYAEKRVPLNGKFKLETLDIIAHAIEKQAITKRLAEYDNDPKKAFKKLEDNPILVKGKRKPLTEVVVWETIYTIKKPLNALNKKQIEKDILDVGISRLVNERLDEHDGDLKKMIASLEESPIWVNEEKGICVKSVKLKTDLKNLKPLHENEKGKPIDFVNLRNNHHFAVYEDENGKFQFEKVSFWEAFERKKNGFAVIKTQHENGWRFVVSLAINEMIVFPKGNDEIDENFILNPDNYATVSEHLYRVQKLSSSGNAPKLNFRHHLATTLNNPNTEIFIQSLKHLNGIFKVTINRLGMITDVQKITPTEK